MSYIMLHTYAERARKANEDLMNHVFDEEKAKIERSVLYHGKEVFINNLETEKMLTDDNVKYYNKIMKNKYEYEPYEIQDIFKRYENYTFKKRLANARHCLFNKDKTCSVRIFDFLFSLFVSKKYLKKILDKEYGRVEEANKCLKKSYDEDIERQKLYIRKAPEQIRKIEQKQKEIAKYLSKYGFKEIIKE